MAEESFLHKWGLLKKDKPIEEQPEKKSETQKPITKQFNTESPSSYVKQPQIDFKAPIKPHIQPTEQIDSEMRLKILSGLEAITSEIDFMDFKKIIDNMSKKDISESMKYEIAVEMFKSLKNCSIEDLIKSGESYIALIEDNKKNFEDSKREFEESILMKKETLKKKRETLAEMQQEIDKLDQIILEENKKKEETVGRFDNTFQSVIKEFENIIINIKNI